LQTGALDVDVLDAEEVEFDVLVEGLVLISLAGGSVGHRINLQTA